MLTSLLLTHSLLRHIILIALVVVIIKSFMAWLNKKPFTEIDNKLSLYLFMLTHMQLVLGLLLYFFSDKVQFNQGTMRNAELRYWSVEHVFIMLVAIVLVSMARITAKKMTDDRAKHKRMFIFNAFALLLIVVAIGMSGRGFI